MRVVMLLAKSTGGIGTHVDDLTSELRGLGHEVLIATDALTASTFGWEQARLLWPEGASRVRHSVAALRGLARGADVVHAHGHQAGVLASLALRALGRRDRPALVVSLHNAVLGGPRRQTLGAISAAPFTRTAQLVTGASSDLAERAGTWGAPWTELAPVPSPRVPGLLGRPVLPRAERQALAHSLLEEAGVPNGRAADIVLTIARIAPQKDLGTFVAASAQDRAEAADHRVWIVVGGGDPDLAERLRAEAQHRAAPVHLVGAQGDPAPWLQAASVFVLTSHWEARALVVQEAMAAGTPVVARDTGGLRDLVAGVGTLVAGSDPRDWATAVAAAVDDEAAWHTASAAGRRRAASWDDSSQTATRWVAWYAQARAMT
ncbi:MAG: glycosyltransferase family 4 protein [Dermatophilaceae bacterium]|nr:glycosyltransferase family 4 protein [Intrasporangiaceae bacterium]